MSWDHCKTRFELIAAKAKLMASHPVRPYSDEVQRTAREISRLADEIDQDMRQYEAGDR